MLDPSKSVSQARNEFLTNGEVRQGIVAEAIQRSWQRCLDHGLDSISPVNSELLTQHEFERRCDQNHLLLSYAKPEMATLNEQIAHTSSMVILTDSEGVILHSSGDNYFLNDSQKLSLKPGSSWHENHRGTNAIGTALTERAAISVQGAEHFMERHHVLSCSAVPIFGGGRELIGTLDVSNDFLLPQQHTLALVKMAAQMIENRIFRASNKSEVVLHFHARPEFIGTLWEGLALFSKDGQLLAINRSGQFQFDIDAQMGDIHFDRMFDQSLSAVMSGVGGIHNMVFPLRLSNGARIFAKMEFDAALSSNASQPIAPVMAPAKRSSAATLDMLDSGDMQVKQVIERIKLVLNHDIPILIEGETGVGKELFARAIHDASDRAEGAWVAVNCASLPEGLIESELFGYEEGAFTGARRKGSLGKLEQANGGTLFLDEIGDMPLQLQARLLRVLQEKSVTPLGSSKAKKLDFMLVSATNQNLREKVKRGEFRKDLYYRLNGLGVNLPALRERSDLDALIKLILQTEHVPHKQISAEVMALFKVHPWPGNIRQLHNVVRTSLALSAGNAIDKKHLMDDFLDDLMAEPAVTDTDPLSAGMLTAEMVSNAMQFHAGNVSAAARQLGISRKTLYSKLKLMGLN
ncbi:MAG: sigma-54-dependent Fis family transcriptional regulator [Methylophilaceae bacterium]